MISLFRLNYQFYSPLYTVVLLLFYLSDGHYVVLCQSYTIKHKILMLFYVFFFSLHKTISQLKISHTMYLNYFDVFLVHFLLSFFDIAWKRAA